MYISLSPPLSVSPESWLINPGKERGSSFPLIARGVYFKTSRRCRNASFLTRKLGPFGSSCGVGAVGPAPFLEGRAATLCPCGSSWGRERRLEMGLGCPRTPHVPLPEQKRCPWNTWSGL